MVAEQVGIGRERWYQTIEEDVALLRENGVRIWNSRFDGCFKVVRLRGNEDEGLRAADTALSLGLPVHSVYKQWPCTSGKRWEHSHMELAILDFNSDEIYYGFDGPDV